MSEVTVHHGDSREVLKGLADASIDSVVCDPPYALVSIGKRFGKPGAAPARSEGASGVYKRASAGFMGQQWDVGDTAFDPEFWVEVLRVLKPGGHVVAFSGARTYHRLACAIEDAGFEIRDQLAWLYGSGFPKSHDVSKGIDKAVGAQRPVVGSVKRQRGGSDDPTQSGGRNYRLAGGVQNPTASATEAARKWEGWGTALKPALEPIVLARKPLIGTVAANVLEHGTGALNIDATRIHADDAQGGSYTVKRLKPGATLDKTGGNWRPEEGGAEYHGEMKPGRWPANIVHDGSDEVLAAFPDAPGQQADISHTAPSPKTSNVYGKMNREGEASASRRYADRGATDFAPLPGQRRGDSGSAARFFYAAEPDDLCGLCGCPSGLLSATLSPCNASTAEPSSPTESTPTGDTAPSVAAASLQQGRGGKSRRSSARATVAESCSAPPRQTASATAAEPALSSDLPNLAPRVRSAGNLCASCATAIAQSLAATQRGHDPASLPCPDSIAAHNWRILTSNLALYVAGREHTGTITTTESLKTLLGSVLHAIAATTSSERAGSAASIDPDRRRFHYSSKADAEDRLGSKHPTVKPIDLMAWLCRLVTPPGGLVLDPFAGTGTTGIAAMREGFDCILIEREAQYVADIERRLAWARGEGRLTAQEMARGEQKPVDDLPLFGGEAA